VDDAAVARMWHGIEARQGRRPGAVRGAWVAVAAAAAVLVVLIVAVRFRRPEPPAALLTAEGTAFVRLDTTGQGPVEQRFADGSRRITEMAEVRAEPESVVVDPVFTFEVEGVDANGLISGTFKATGHRPRFLEELNERGLEVDMSIFTS